MFSAADIIEALGLRRRFKSIRPETPGQMPPGWQSWLDGMSASPRAVVGALPGDVIAELAQRPLAHPPPRVASLNRWQAFGTLWRQQWHAPAREERGMRMFAAFFSGLVHLFFAIMLLFLAYVRVPPPPGATAGDTVVQVEFIGEGAPKETGGGAPQGPQPEPAAAAAAPAAPPVEAPSPQPEPTPPQPTQAEPVAAQPPAEPDVAQAQPEPEPAPPVEVPPAPQPLEVTQVPQPDTTFVLPPPRPLEAQLPQAQIVVPEARQPTERISRVERPQRQAIEVERIAPQAVRITPVLRAQEQARLSETRAITVTPAPTRELQVPSVRAQVREIPMPSRGTTPSAPQPGTSTSTAPSASPGATTAATQPAGGQPAPGSGVAPAAQPGTGTTPDAPPGAWPSPNVGDDWGVGTRNRPGGPPGTEGAKPGIFKADGTPNLGTTPSPGQNAPGTVEANLADLDRAGRWLKRPGYEYTPTKFDKYWRPHETLLQEWVRKGIRTLRIRIPGTSTSIECAVSLLALGGACGLSNPDVNDQPASARPPPDIPFKPHLQEDNGSVRMGPPAPRTSTTPATTP